MKATSVGPPSARQPAPGTSAGPVAGITSWVYQLQGYPHGRLDAIVAGPHELAVIDLARDGSTSYFTRDEIAALQHRGKRALAYFEIGAIEDYRPEYRAVRDSGLVLNRWPDWPEEYFVRYWEPAWWDLAVRPRVDQALAAGFDGVYLDTPLAYEEIDLNLISGETRATLARKMVNLIIRISRYAKDRRSGFLVLPQNSPELAEQRGYVDAVDGIGMEELFFRATGEATDIPCAEDYCAENLAGARALRDAGKLVLAVDYAVRPENVAAACRRYRAERFAGYVTVRALDQIRPTCKERQ